MQDEVLIIEDLTLDPQSRTAIRGNKKSKLSPQECNLLKFLLKNLGRAVSREKILQKIWHYQPDIESRVVDVYMGYLRRKIDSGNNKKIIKTVRGQGYMIEF